MFNKFAAGKKVYSHGSYAPTRGTVNPAGYIKRELRNRTKNSPPAGVRSNAGGYLRGRDRATYAHKLNAQRKLQSKFGGRPAPMKRNASQQHRLKQQKELHQHKVKHQKELHGHKVQQQEMRTAMENAKLLAFLQERFPDGLPGEQQPAPPSTNPQVMPAAMAQAPTEQPPVGQPSMPDPMMAQGGGPPPQAPAWGHRFNNFGQQFGQDARKQMMMQAMLQRQQQQNPWSQYFGG